MKPGDFAGAAVERQDPGPTRARTGPMGAIRRAEAVHAGTKGCKPGWRQLRLLWAVSRVTTTREASVIALLAPTVPPSSQP